MAVDVFPAVAALLLADPTVASIAGTNVFVAEVPFDLVENMPTPMAIIKPAGGMEDNDYLPTIRPRFEMWCYARSYAEASPLDLAIFEVLHNLAKTVINKITLWSCAVGSGPWMRRDTDTAWPVVLRQYTLLAAHVAEP